MHAWASLCQKDASLSACQGMLIFPMTSQDVRLLKENNTDGFKCSRGPDFHSVIAQHFLVIIIH